jgi:hypothetical protein
MRTVVLTEFLVESEKERDHREGLDVGDKIITPWP